MPLIDKPLEELYGYMGTNPRPADHDAYWARALSSMHAMGTNCELIPAAFQAPGIAECFDLYFTGVGGARVHAKLLKPARAEGRRPAVCTFHGYTGSAGEWQDKLNYVAAGFYVAALDCRGQAGQSQDVGGALGNTHHGHIIRGLSDPDPDKLLFRSLFLDTAQLARVVMAMPGVDPDRVGAIGGSQGGGLTLACASLEPRIRIAIPSCPFLCDYKRVWEMDLAKDAYAELKTFFRNFDPQHKRADEYFTKLGYIDVQFLTPRIRAQVLMSCGLMDTICPPSTQFAAYNRIPSKKAVEIYPDFAHEGYPGFSDMAYQLMLTL